MRQLFSLLFVVTAFMMTVPSFAQDIDNPNDSASFTIADLVTDAATMDEGAQFTVFFEALQTASPAMLEILANDQSDITLFLPLDSGFDTLSQNMGQAAFDALFADPNALTNMVSYHMVNGSFASDSLFSLNGQPLPTLLEGQGLSVNPMDVGVMIGNGSFGVAFDIQAKNGVIHVINAPLMPPTQN